MRTRFHRSRPARRPGARRADRHQHLPGRQCRGEAAGQDHHRLQRALKPGSAGAEIVMTAMPGMADHPPMVIKAFTNELADDGKSLVLKLKNPLPVGSYTVNWTATGMDGDPINGSIDFRVE